jgi:hypothetical protein
VTIATKRNRSSGKLGHKRGVPIRLARAIAKKYRLDQLVIFTVDRDRAEERSRIVVFGRSDAIALQASAFAKQVATAANWPKENCEIEISSIRRLKNRIHELETACAQIVDGCPDPVGLARAAGKFPDESEGETPGLWVFHPDGKLSREQFAAEMAAHNVLSSEQLAADSVRGFAFATAKKIARQSCTNLAGEIETAIREAVRKFGGRRRKE